MISLAALVQRIPGYLYLAFISVLMLAPVIIVVLVSLSPTPVFEIPAGAASLQWYRKLLVLDGLWPAVRLSVQVAGLTTMISLMLGGLFALGLIRGRFPGRNGLLVFVLSPMMLPGVVIGIAMLFAFRGIGLRDSYASLMISHVVITIPYVVRILYGGLSLFEFDMIDAAQTLGCSYPRALWRVLTPNIFPSVLTGGMFAFLASMDNYALALFMGDVRNVTLPVQLLKYIESAADPSLAAISTVMVTLTLLVIILAERLVGLRRLVGG
jgi:putative spermidine/putrescine transport system permease protein